MLLPCFSSNPLFKNSFPDANQLPKIFFIRQPSRLNINSISFDEKLFVKNIFHFYKIVVGWKVGFAEYYRAQKNYSC